MTIQKKILIFTATYNEKENIETLINSIFNNCPYADVLIIDDNSPDNTSQKIKELQNKFKNILLITRNSKLGLDTVPSGSRLFRAVNFCCEKQFLCVFTCFV